MPITIGSFIIVGLLVLGPVAAIRSFYLDYKEKKERDAQKTEQN